MAIVNVSLDTDSRQVVLTVNGVLVSAQDVSIDKFTFDGEVFVNFSYTIESTDINGMLERRQFYLPSLEALATEAHAGLDADGFSSKVVHDDAKAKADVVDFLKQRKNPGT